MKKENYIEEYFEEEKILHEQVLHLGVLTPIMVHYDEVKILFSKRYFSPPILYREYVKGLIIPIKPKPPKKKSLLRLFGQPDIPKRN